MRSAAPFLLLCLPVAAQDVQYVQTMHDKIPVYGSWLPIDQRAATLDPARDNETVWIPEGQTATLNRSETALDVVCWGTLNFQGKASLKVRTLQIIGPDSALEIIESNAEPRDRIIFRDLPVDTEHAPAQYGNGLVVIDGRLTVMAPHHRQPFAMVGGCGRRPEFTQPGSPTSDHGSSRDSGNQVPGPSPGRSVESRSVEAPTRLRKPGGFPHA